MNYRHTALVLAALVFTAACDDDDDDDGTGPTGQAQVRVVNATPDNATVSVLNGNTTLANSLAFGTNAACVTVPAGSQTLTFRSGTTTLATTTATNFANGGRYTVVLSGSGATPTATVYTDTYTAPTAGNNVLRFINTTSTAGDVYLTTAEGEVTGTATVPNLGANAEANYASYPATDVRARLFDAGTTTTARGDVTIPALTNGAANAGTVIFTTPTETVTSSGFVVQPCGT